jgi:hypothetical protein
MIAFNGKCNDNSKVWQNDFLSMLPEIERRLRFAFCQLDPAAKDEAIAEGVAHSLFAYRRLNEQDRTEVATSSTLAWYSSRQVMRGRPAAGRMNGREPLSRHGQLTNRIKIERLPSKWIDAIVLDKRAAIPDVIAAKMDVGAWFATLTQRMRQIANDLAFGCSTSEVAKKYGVTAGRISQLRRTLKESWATFQQDPKLA